MLAAPEELGYRNRAQFKTDGSVLGYVSPVSHKIVDIKSCPILTTKNQATLEELRELLPRPEWHSQSEWTALNINESVDAKNVAPGKDLGFLQGNSQQNERMKNWLRDHLKNADRGLAVLELFCGSGNFTEVITSLGFEDVLAVEGSREAVRELKAKWPQVKAISHNLYGKKAPKEVKKLMSAPGLMVLDPPRTGLQNISEWISPELQELYYISCSPVTFVRDAQNLADKGMALLEIQPIDLFPHTPHLEILAKFQKLA